MHIHADKKCVDACALRVSASALDDLSSEVDGKQGLYARMSLADPGTKNPFIPVNAPPGVR
eukprot:9323492-Karenia_brevis.AAC.1